LHSQRDASLLAGAAAGRAGDREALAALRRILRDWCGRRP